MASAKFPHVRLGHMLDEIDAIISATRGIAAETVMADYVTTRAVERAIQIVSEAAKQLPQEVRALDPDVPWPEIVGIGNLLRHEYYRIKTSEIKAILTEHLPRLRPAIVRLLAKFEP